MQTEASSFTVSKMSLVLATSVLTGLLISSTAPAADPVTPPVFSNPLNSTNEYAPFEAEGFKVYSGKDEGEKIVVIDFFSAETRTFMVDGNPVECALLKEVEFEEGELIEISCNYFAEADDGTVYYFGETVDNYEDGVVVDNEGSWLVGGPTLPSDPPTTATALEPAVFMPGNPEVGDSWKPEDIFPIVDETVTLKKEGQKQKLPAGKFKDTIKVEETTQLDPKSKETKWYAPGVGFIRAKQKQESLKMIASTFQAK